MTLPRIIVSEPYPQLFSLVFRSRRALASTFLRFQEFYESPNSAFRGSYFTLAGYRDWYEEQCGAFSYYEDWSGFNVPGEVICHFASGAFDPLSAREGHLLTTIAAHTDLGPKGAPFYVIGTTGTLTDMFHELAHGLWYLDRTYRRRMEGLLAQFPASFRRDFAQALGPTGYCADVMPDELQAYLISDDGADWFAHVGLDLSPYVRTLAAIKACFASFFPALP